jgi:hypothetical protein
MDVNTSVHMRTHSFSCRYVYRINEWDSRIEPAPDGTPRLAISPQTQRITANLIFSYNFHGPSCASTAVDHDDGAESLPRLGSCVCALPATNSVCVLFADSNVLFTRSRTQGVRNTSIRATCFSTVDSRCLTGWIVLRTTT